MYVLGLTGSIGMGKTTAATAFRRLGIAVHDADKIVHGLMGYGGAAVHVIAEAFPGVTVGGAVDRKKLGDTVFNDSEALKRLEMILHPMVRYAEAMFMETAMRRGDKMVVLDIPLLFETGGERRCDGVAVVSAPPFVQAARVLPRPGMTYAKFNSILEKQMPDRDKRNRADFLIPTGLGKYHSLRVIRKIIKKCTGNER